MAVITVSQTTDFSGQLLAGPVTAVEFNLASDASATASFAAGQVDGAPLVTNLQLIGSAGRDTFRVFGGSIDASAWTFSTWTDIDGVTFEFVDSVILEGSGGKDTIIGAGDVSDILMGLDGDDVLDSHRLVADSGDNSASQMHGGKGNDLYVIGKFGGDDQLIEFADQGSDTVQSSAAAFVLAAFVEHLTLTGIDAIAGTGNGLDNALTGNKAANKLVGLWGNDTLDGGLGADTLIGGHGDDLYQVNSLLDTVTELANGGFDKVIATTTYALSGNVEDLTLSGWAVGGVGNASANMIIGNALANKLVGHSGADTLDGGLGADTLVGGDDWDRYLVDTSDDTVVEHEFEGEDTVVSKVSYALGSHVEDLYLIGTASNGTGNATSNLILGNDVNNKLTGFGGSDILFGGKGSDTMIGGIGDDTYTVDSLGDVVTELLDQGNNDVITTLVSLTLPANVEILNLSYDSGAINGSGNALANRIEGNGSNNVLRGHGGDDFLDGSSGNDTLFGGAGNDVFILQQAGDIIVERADEGFDEIRSTISATLPGGVEKLRLIANVGGLVATGNRGNNIIQGDEQDQTLTGGGGLDFLTGRYGKDVFNYDEKADSGTTAASRDVISDFTSKFKSASSDRIDLATIDAKESTGFSNEAFTFIGTGKFWAEGQVRAVQQRSYTILEVNTSGASGAEMTIQLTGVDASTLATADFVL